MDRVLIERVARALCASLVLLVATSVGAQTSSDSQADDWGASETATQSPSRSQGGIFDEDAIRGYREFEGFYAQFGASVGEIEFDGGNDVDTGGGFTMTGGYRFFPWLAGEANLSYLGGGEVDGTNREADFFSVTFGPKLFPMGLVEEQPIPEYLQPYMLIAIGGGEYDVERTSFEESTFIARFIFGFDLWFTDHLGGFMEGGYHVAADDDIDGTGLFTIGAQYRF
jgi:hypothetical protein